MVSRSSVFRPQRFKLTGHPLAGLTDLVLMQPVGADAGNPQEIAQLLLKISPLFIQILIQIRHFITTYS